jgi:hypothetical protein
MKDIVARVVHEPLMHFVLIGLVIFWVFDVMDDTPDEMQTMEIVVSEQVASRLAESFAGAWRRPPNTEELDGLIDDFIREEVLVREAFALGLNRNDTVIRKRLRQKMVFLASAAVAASTPSEDVLRVHYAETKDDFYVEGRLALTQVFLGAEPGDASVQAIRRSLDDGESPATLGVGTLMPTSLPLSSPSTIDNTFGRGFNYALLDLEIGNWSEPLRSGYGYHLIRVDQIMPGQVPDFDTVKDSVQRRWLEAQTEILEEAYFKRLLEQYTVVRPDLTAVDQP